MERVERVERVESRAEQVEWSGVGMGSASFPNAEPLILDRGN